MITSGKRNFGYRGRAGGIGQYQDRSRIDGADLFRARQVFADVQHECRAGANIHPTAFNAMAAFARDPSLQAWNISFVKQL
ncbi:MAG: hypothetical protein ABIR62_09055 [Dokdonella sp.]|uniref:hypothetical protein n=1 Tax=Dokdonella sp. TaxID=2291710 RepID=UPI003267FD1D